MIAHGVIPSLRLFVMLTAIQLNDQSLLEADEIDDVISQPVLTTKFQTVECTVAKLLPEKILRLRRRVPHLSRGLDCESTLGPLTPSPSPARGEGHQLDSQDQRTETRSPRRCLSRGGAWITHCLELDVVAEAPNADAAMKDLLDLCAFQIDTAIENNDLESIFRPAPAKYWNLFYSARQRRRLPKAQHAALGKFDAREFVVSE